jgi:hypothetical protein
MLQLHIACYVCAVCGDARLRLSAPDRVDRRIEPTSIASDDRDRGSFSGELHCDRQADPACAAGDQCNSSAVVHSFGPVRCDLSIINTQSAPLVR